MYDVIVVGARCGGSPTAMLLARRGHRVLLLDRASFPSDVVSTHHVTTPGIARLARWGLLGQVVASGCPPIRRMAFESGGIVLTGTPPPVDGVADQYCVRRTVLDTILAGAAVEAGAELWEGFVVGEVAFDGDRVLGVRGRSPRGADVLAVAPLVVGADGLHSLVAQEVEAPRFAERPPLTCSCYAYWRGVALPGAEIRNGDRRAVSAFPTNDDLACIAVRWPAAETQEFRHDVEHNYLRTLQLAPELAEQVRDASRVGPFVVTADVPNFFRKPWGAGWALVGDAGYHKDPYLAQGISDAFRDAELLAGAIDDALSGNEGFDEGLAGYERRRNQAAAPGYDLNTRLATLEPPSPEMTRVLHEVQNSQEETDRFLGVLSGAVPVPDSFLGQQPPVNDRLVQREAVG
jgi:flavin-dependent dehydrogenase